MVRGLNRHNRRLLGLVLFTALSGFEGISLQQHRFGGDGEKVTPVPIPNTEVKLFSADGSWDFVPVRVGHR